jgi:hypothetical protein
MRERGEEREVRGTQGGLAAGPCSMEETGWRSEGLTERRAPRAHV